MLSRKFLLLATLFFILFSLLIAYLFLYRSNAFVFWAIVLSSAVLLLFQIMSARVKSEVNIIYVEIVVLFAGLQLINIAHAGLHNLFWLDAYYELVATENIIEGKWDPRILGTLGPYPAIHFLTAALSQITSAHIIDVARWMGLLTHTIALVFYLMLVETIFRNNKVTLLSGLGFVFLFYYVMTSGFGRMPLSMTLFFLVLFLVMRNRSMPKANVLILATLSLATLIFAHPLPPVVLVLFLGALALGYQFVYRGKASPSNLSTPLNKLRLSSFKPSSTIFVLLAVFGIGAHFLYISIWAQQLLYEVVYILVDTGTPKVIGTAAATPFYWRIFLFGQAIMGLIFAGLVFMNRKSREDLPCLLLISFAGFLSGWALLAYYLRIELMRFTLFLWPFALMAVSYSIMNSKRRNILSLLIVAFIIVNLFGYFPFKYDKSIEPKWAMGEWRRYVSEQERSAMMKFDVGGEVVGNHYFNMAFLYYRNKQIHTDGDFFIEGFSEPNIYSWFFFGEQDKERIFIRDLPETLRVSEELYSNYQKTPSMLRVYDNGAVLIFKICQPPR
ncbi:MAG: hypothetical protein DDT40_01405 [candidate division WS2 bacterium]|nr:hypothetical protein [Candidatus Psychracetigena formicireducens]